MEDAVVGPVVFACFALTGLCFLVVGLKRLSRTRTELRRASFTDGEVIELVPQGRKRMYYPRVRFEPIEDVPVEFVSSVGSRPAMHRVGQQVRVRYDPEDLDSADLDNWMTRWFVPALTLFFGVVFSLVGLGGAALFGLVGLLGRLG